MDVGVGRAGHVARHPEEQLGNLQPGAEREHDQQECRKCAQVPRRAPGQVDAACRVEPELLAEQICGHRRGCHQQDDEIQDAVNLFEQGQREDVETDIPSKDGIELAERRPVQEIQPGLPARAGVEPNQHRDDGDRGQAEPLDTAQIHGNRLRALRRHNHERPWSEPAQRCERIASERRKNDQSGAYRHQRAGAQGLQEHLLVADFLEPQPVGVELSQCRQAGHDEHESEKQWNAADSHDGLILYASRSPAVNLKTLAIAIKFPDSGASPGRPGGRRIRYNRPSGPGLSLTTALGTRGAGPFRGGCPMADDLYFDGDPAEDSRRRHLERVIKGGPPRRRWPWVMAILAGGAWTAWRMTHPKNNNDQNDRRKADGA